MAHVKLALTDHGTCLTNRLPFSNDVRGGAEVVLTDIVDFIAKSVQGELESIRHSIRVEVTRGGIGQNRFHPVVGRHNDKAFAVTHVESVIVGNPTVGNSGCQIDL